MNSVIEKMEEIYTYTKNQKENGPWNQKVEVDLHQEMQRQNHIFNHHGRAVANPSGRWFGIAFGAMIGLICASNFARSVKRYSPKPFGIMATGTFIGSVLGFNYMTRKFGDRADYKVFQTKKIKVDSMMKEYEKFFN
jgi:hypothetical protein